MAIVPGGPLIKITASNSSDTIELGPGGEAGQGGALALTFVPDANFIGSITVKAKTASPYAVSTSATIYQPVPYRRILLNGTVSDYTVVSAAIVPTSSSSMILVPANGIAIGLTITSASSGSCEVYTLPMGGAVAL